MANFTHSSTYDGQTLLALGYGSTEFGGAYSNDLRAASVKGISNNQCANIYGSSITVNDMCTYSKGNDTCQVLFHNFT